MQLVAHIQMPEGAMLHCLMPEDGPELLLGDKCLCELDCGQDVGTLSQVTELSLHAAAPTFRVVRKLTADDEAVLQANVEVAQKARQSFQLSVRYEKTPVKALHTRFSFGRERLFIRYSAAIAVDLRRFVSQIQRDYKTQVDLWQVGMRDETALVGCVGICGREACCCAWMRQFPSPGTRMARAQDVPPNPATANGRCGRLKCCLAFEYEQYRQAGQSLPETGSTVETQEGSGVVVDRNVMCGRLTVRLREGKVLKLTREDVVSVHTAHPGEQAKGDVNEDSVGEWSEP